MTSLIAKMDDVWITACFAGEPAPPAPLTWGQQALWIANRRRGKEQVASSLRRTLATPRRARDDVDSVVRAIAALVGRHSSLRTRLRLAGGQPHQVVAARGELPVRLVRAGELGLRDGGDADPTGAGAATTVAAQLAATPFDHAQEWPQRVALVLVAERVRQIVFVFSHTTVDFHAAELVLRDLRLLLLRGAVTTPPGPQSVDVARREEGPDRHRTERAIRYWRDAYTRLPREVLPAPGPALAPRFRRAVLTSAAADSAIRLIATRNRVTTATVLVAATAATIGAWSGTDASGIHTMTSNRALPGYQDAIAKLNQVGLVVVDLADRPSFADLLPRVWQAALAAYRHAHYHPAELDRALAEGGLANWDRVSPHCFLNDIRLAIDADLFGRAVAEAEVRAAAQRSSLAWTPGLDRFTWRMRVEIVDAPAAIGIALTADTAALRPEAIERFLRDLEALLVDAAFRDPQWPWTPAAP